MLTKLRHIWGSSPLTLAYADCLHICGHEALAGVLETMYAEVWGAYLCIEQRVHIYRIYRAGWLKCASQTSRYITVKISSNTSSIMLTYTYVQFEYTYAPENQLSTFLRTHVHLNVGKNGHGCDPNFNFRKELVLENKCAL